METNLKSCSGCGMLWHIFPIPHCISGCWYKRQWTWYKTLFKRILCVFKGHRLIVRRYDYISLPSDLSKAIPDFDAVECEYCSERFALVYDYERIEKAKQEKEDMKAMLKAI